MSDSYDELPIRYALDLLGDVPKVTTRKMMGEYLLYAQGKLFGGVYDERFLVKDTPACRAVLSVPEVPYEGASEMLQVDYPATMVYVRFSPKHVA